MANIRVPIDVNGNVRHGSAVRLLEKHGVPAPVEYMALRERIEAYTAINRPMTDRLIAAVLSGDDADQVPALRAASIAEQVRSDVDETVVAAGWRQLRDIYDTVAPDTYRTIAERYNAAAVEFTAAASVVSPTATADQVIDLPSAAQKAWRKGQELSAQLDDLSVLLQTAAMLTGVENAMNIEYPATSEPWKDGMKSMLIGLCCDPGELHRRQVWTAFGDGWAATVALGVELKAADLDTFEAYRKPRQLLERRVVEHGVTRYLVIDPEDAEPAQAVQ